MSTDSFLYPYRGDLVAIESIGSELIFITRHPEQQSLEIHRFNVESVKLNDSFSISCKELPTPVNCLAVDKGQIWVGGDDGFIYYSENWDSELNVIGDQFIAIGKSKAFTAIQSVKNKLVVLFEKTLYILDAITGKKQQAIELLSIGTSLAINDSGDWIVIGTDTGYVQVFNCEKSNEYLQSSSAQLHEGAVTALLFYPQEARFLSAAKDNKLYSTHARGRLDPEDKGRSYSHADAITSLMHTIDGCFVTGSLDGSCKTWPLETNKRPATFNVGAGVIDVAMLSLYEKNYLAVANEKKQINIIAFDDNGKLHDELCRINGFYELARFCLSKEDPTEREKMIRVLAKHDDAQALELLVKQAKQDKDISLRILVSDLLVHCQHKKVAKSLEDLLKHKDEVVRLNCFHGLCERVDSDDFHPLDLALKSGKSNIAIAAICKLEQLANTDDRAMIRIEQALNNSGAFDIRCAALQSLEKLYESDSAEANIIASMSEYADIRKISLIRLAQRNFLHEKRVLSVIRRRLNDDDGDVRFAAFMVSLLSQKKLSQSIRERDENIHRQLFDIETLYVPLLHGDVNPYKNNHFPTISPSTIAPSTIPVSLYETDNEPLLQATASQSIDSCLLGAHCLAVLQDSRALGLLLQLSCDNKASVRVSACDSLMVLNHIQANERLIGLLSDDSSDVREAAYNALDQKQESKNIDSLFIKSALKVPFEDVRRRAIQLVTIVLNRKTTHKTGDVEPVETLAHFDFLFNSLDDHALIIRSEAYKAVLKINHPTENILRRALLSIYADIRKEVQTEAMAYISESWSWSLLYDLLNDSDSSIRKDSFEYLLKKVKKKDLTPLEQAITSDYSDVRLLAVEELASRSNKESQFLLVEAVDDKEKNVRESALSAIIDRNVEDVLVKILNSRFVDTRIKAACALAKMGSVAALPVLYEVVLAEEPESGSNNTIWSRSRVIAALEGVAILGQVDSFEHVSFLTQNSDKEIRRAAAEALLWCFDDSNEKHVQLTKNLLQHTDDYVHERARLALIIQQLQHNGKMLQLSENSSLPPMYQLVAAMMSGDEMQLARFLSLDSDVSYCAVIVMIILDYCYHTGNPSRILSILSAKNHQLRILGAEALLRYNNAESSLQYIVWLLNWSDDHKKQTNQYIQLLTQSHPQVRARTLLLTPAAFISKEGENWNHLWEHHYLRFGKSEEYIHNTAASNSVASSDALNDEFLIQSVFGVYTALVRDQNTDASLRKTSLHKLKQLLVMSETASPDLPLTASLKTVFRQALSDPDKAVRTQALDYLLDIDSNFLEIADECLDAGFNDVGAKGLELLVTYSNPDVGYRLVEQAMLMRTDSLAIDAAQQLMKTQSIYCVAEKALKAKQTYVREQAVDWLSQDYQNSDSRQVLELALKSRYQDVRENAAEALAIKKNPHAFESLVEALKHARNSQMQRRFVNALLTLGDSRTVNVFLDRLEYDPDETADISLLLSSAAKFRRTEEIERMYSLIDKPKLCYEVVKAIYVISGFDQEFLEDNNGRALKAQNWEEKQFPRHDSVLAELIERYVAIKNYKERYLKTLINDAGRAKSHAVNNVLSQLTRHVNSSLRELAIFNVGWRARYRNGPLDSLITALSHKEEQTRFEAAHVLALAGSDKGISILMAGVELLSDLQDRHRALSALGHLSNERSLDLLLTIASNDEHALQYTATEAIGHLRNTDKSHEIYELLKKGVHSDDLLIWENAVKGLRWFNSEAGWVLIRQIAADKSLREYEGMKAIEVLAENKCQATEDLLLSILAEPKNYEEPWVLRALKSARSIFGYGSLLPDYAYVKSGLNIYSHNEHGWEVLSRINEQGDASIIFDIIPSCHTAVQTIIEAALQRRDPKPVKAAIEALSHSNYKTVQVAAKIVGYSTADGDVSSLYEISILELKLQQTLNNLLAEWLDVREKNKKNIYSASKTLNGLGDCLQALIWLAGRLGIAKNERLNIAANDSDDRQFDFLRYEALLTIVNDETLLLSDSAQSLFKQALYDYSGKIRQLAAVYFKRSNVENTQEFAKDLFSDRHVFNRISEKRHTTKPTSSLNVSQTNFLQNNIFQALKTSNYSAVVQRYIIQSSDVDSLMAVANDTSLDDVIRFGAVESMANIVSEKALIGLCDIGKNMSYDDDLRKLAWRGRRRLKRKLELAPH